MNEIKENKHPHEARKKHRLKADGGDRNDPEPENGIQSGNRNSEEDSGWNEDGTENPKAQLGMQQKTL